MEMTELQQVLFRRRGPGPHSPARVTSASRSAARPCLIPGLLALLLTAPASLSAGPVEDEDDLLSLSIEELMEIEITSVSKAPQKLFDAAAAIYVLTAEDIAGSGATSLPDLFRLVPGMMVAQVGSHEWAVTARGFNATTANKLQVLLDGRTLYTPLFSGVFWEVQNLPLDQIERIEVIRGPGATLWGANAVNGVINIITKVAAATPGGSVSLAVGTEDRAIGALRYGGETAGGKAHYRVSLRYFDRDEAVFADGSAALDAWDMVHGEFRIDGGVDGEGAGDRWTVLGGAYTGAADEITQISLPEEPFAETSFDDNELDGAHLLGRWVRAGEGGGETSVQGYVEVTSRNIPRFFGEDRISVDLDLQRRSRQRGKHRVIWGARYRLSSDDVENSFTISWDPASTDFQLISVFAQDEITFAGGRGSLIAGAKIEYNDFTDFEVQPNLRVAWRPDDNRTLWAAVSRSVRTPSRLDHDARLNAAVTPGEPPTRIALVGNDGFGAETALTYELGYRARLGEALVLDLAAFYADYEGLLSIESRVPFFEDGFLVVPFEFSNLLRGESHGVELAWSWRATDGLTLHSALSYFDRDLSLDPSSTDAFTDTRSESDPQLYGFLRAAVDLSERVKLDAALRFVDELEASMVDAYTELDVSLRWRLSDRVTLAVAGRNLLDDEHAEFGAEPVLVERSLLGAIRWDF